MSRVSVALATFNGMPYLEAQLRSIEMQTAPVAELVACDDGSSDGTWECLARFAGSRPHVRCLRNPRRLGVAANFERAIAECTGDVIFLCDQDDVWRPDKVARLAGELERRSAMLAMSNAALVSADGRALGRDLWTDSRLGRELQEQLQSERAWEALVGRKYFTGSALCFRAEARPVVLPIPPGAWHDQWIALMVAMAWPGRLALIDEPLHEYRQHARNQIGARQGTFLKRAWREVRSSADIENDVRMLRAALERLERLPGRRDAGRMADLLRESLRHAEGRQAFVMGQRPWLDVAAAQRLRDYRRFSRGFTTVARDLLLRLLRPDADRANAGTK